MEFFFLFPSVKLQDILDDNECQHLEPYLSMQKNACKTENQLKLALFYVRKEKYHLKCSHSFVLFHILIYFINIGFRNASEFNILC